MNKIFIAAVFSLLLLDGFSQYMPSGQVRYKTHPSMGVITLTVDVFGSEKDDRENEAVSAALYTLVFTGVPGSKYEFPLVTDANMRNHTAIKKLLGEGKNEFITQKQMSSEDRKTSRKNDVRGKNASYDISVNYEALRRYLEQNKVIIKFGI